MDSQLCRAPRTNASDSDALSLACDSGFIWRPFYNRNGVAIACAKQIQAGDTLSFFVSVFPPQGFQCFANATVHAMSRWRLPKRPHNQKFMR
jgi:hypothetical protein